MLFSTGCTCLAHWRRIGGVVVPRLVEAVLRRLLRGLAVWWWATAVHKRLLLTVPLHAFSRARVAGSGHIGLVHPRLMHCGLLLLIVLHCVELRRLMHSCLTWRLTLT